MAKLTTARLAIHGFIPVLLVLCLLWTQTPFWEIIVTLGLVTCLDLVYITSIIIQNINVSKKSIAFEGKDVIVTGGSSGIGFSIAKQLVHAKAGHVVLVARNEERLKKSVESLNRLVTDEQKVSYIAVDLSKDYENLKSKIDTLAKSISSLDILINCAGYSLPGEFLNLTAKDFQDMINTNYLASVYITHAVIPHMIKKRFGQVAFLSSVGGQLPIAGFTAYSPSKYAIRGFAEVLQSEMRPHNIGVTLAFPPDTKTPGFEEENKRKPKVTQVISEQVGLWESDDVAKIIVDGIKSRKFMVGFGSDGYFVNSFTAGAAPASSTLEFWLQTLLAPVIKVYYLIAMQNFFTNVIEDEYVKQKKD